MPPRYQSTLLSFEEKARNLFDHFGQPAHRGHARVGGGVSRGASGLAQSLIQLPDAGAESSGAAQLLVLSTTGDSIASGGDAVTFDTILAQHGFDGVVTQAGQGWVHPITGVYVLTLVFEWDSYQGGGTVELEIDGIVRADGLLVEDDGSGQRAIAMLPYHAETGEVAKIKVTQSSGSAQTCDATVRVAVSDPAESATLSTTEWTKVYEGDVYDLHFDGTNWWTTENDTDTVTKRDTDWASVASWSSGWRQTRGIVLVGSSVWVAGDKSFGFGEVIGEFDTSGSSLTEQSTGGGGDGNRGLAYDGTDLWLVENQGNVLERYDTATVTLQETLNLTSGVTYSGVTHYAGLLYLVDQTNSQILVIESDGTVRRTIDTSGATENATGIWISDSGDLYLAKDGDGVYLSARKVFEL